MTNKILHYQITEDTQECEFDMAFFISEYDRGYQQEVKVLVNFYDPSNINLKSLYVSTQNQTPPREVLKLDQVGSYTMIFSNQNKIYLTFEMELALTNCLKKEMKMQKQDMVLFQNKLQKEYLDQKFIINSNFSSRYKMKRILKKKLRETHSKLYYATLLECLIIFVLSVWQIIYIRKLLENKQLI